MNRRIQIATVTVIAFLTFASFAFCQDENLSIKELVDKKNSLLKKMTKISDAIRLRFKDSESPDEEEISKAINSDAEYNRARDEWHKYFLKLGDFQLSNLKYLKENFVEGRLQYRELGFDLKPGRDSNPFFVLRGELRQHQLFRLDPMAKALNLDSKTGETLKKAANDLNSLWGESVNEEIRSYEPCDGFVKYKTAVKDFEDLVHSKLSPSKRNRVAEIRIRSKWNDVGIPKQLDLESDKLGISKKAALEIAKNLKLETEEISEEGNALFRELIDELFPGYMETESERFEKRTLPLGLFLQALNFEVSIRRNNRCKKSFVNFPLSLEKGMWAFPLPRLERFGENVWSLSEPYGPTEWIPESGPKRLFLMSKIGDVTKKQFDLLQEAYALPTARSENGRVTLRDRFNRSKEYNRLLESILLDIQLVDYRDKMKILALISLGPDTIQRHIELEGKLSKADYERKLEKMKSELHDFLRETEDKLYERLTEEVNARSRKQIDVKYFGQTCFFGYDNLMRTLQSVK